ncbi:MAG: hypothetical protein AVDCRST_MAG02-4885 [uncultured Rubrobacteraceae bacterium]|uniref:N-acetyltransferase domain-containing protein n=1 Tax=uncultured Rubrobacteraceae bacterium TaxID=349277 RepID=A0A6J4RXJ1_9ACTN|nr:MAG: hypothetical protein AVDCRST_MAG02-4885 [uncultured Rubrobacteraceae bacterium]
MTGAIEAARARPPDLGTVLSILDSILEEAAPWLASRGTRQWEPGTLSHGRIGLRIGRGEVYLFVLGGPAVGTLVLQWSDEETWGDVPDDVPDDDAGCVRGLAVRREGAGKGLGRELLRRAEVRVADAGRAYLRPDCGAENRAPNDYYAGAGFRCRGRARVCGVEVSLYEKTVGAAAGG